MISIDEAIARAREVANEQKRRSGICVQNDLECDKFSSCLKCAEEHEQIAEWLELLKWYEQGMEDIPSESGVLPKDVYHAGYNKALDDFVQLVHECDWKINNRKENSFIYGAIDWLAEQLKAGGENEKGI